MMIFLNMSVVYSFILLEFEDKVFLGGESVYRYDDMICCDMIYYDMTIGYFIDIFCLFIEILC